MLLLKCRCYSLIYHTYLYNNLPRRRVNMLGEQMFKYLCIKFQDHWYPERPTKGSAYRSIRINNEKVDKILIDAAINVSLNLQEILDNLPKDLTIWIDPGEVSYRIEEKGLVQILYRNQDYPLHVNFFPWISTPILSVQTFAQTKFGSLKNKYFIRQHQS